VKAKRSLLKLSEKEGAFISRVNRVSRVVVSKGKPKENEEEE